MNYKDHFHQKILQVGHMLGRDISVSDAGDVATFSDFSNADLAELRALNQRYSVMALFYIRFRLKERAAFPQAVSFLDEVIRQGRSLEEWLEDECRRKRMQERDDAIDGGGSAQREILPAR